MADINLNMLQAAKYLCVSLSKLQKMTHRKEIKYSKVGRLNVFRKEHLDEYLDAHQVLTAEQLKKQFESNFLHFKIK